LGPISATDMPVGAPDICGSAACALVDISALAIMVSNPFLIRCRGFVPLFAI